MPTKHTSESLKPILEEFGLVLKSEYCGSKIPILCEDKYGTISISVEDLHRRTTTVNNNIKSSINPPKYIEKYLKLNNPYLNSIHFDVKQYIDRKNIVFETKYGGCKSDLATLLKTAAISPNMALNKSEFFVNKSKELYPNTYDYDKTVYTESNKHLVLTCPYHGDFKILPSNHLSGAGCSKCNKKGCYVLNNKRVSSDKINLYLVKCKSEIEEFHKIGLTKVSTYRRMSKLRPKYTVEILKEIQLDAYEAISKEKELHLIYKDYNYIPLEKFAGRTECFLLSPDQVETIQNYFSS